MFGLFSQTTIIEMPSLNRNEEVTCGDRGTSVTKYNLSQHKSCCSGGAFYCPKCPNFFFKSTDHLNYQIAKQHSEAGPSKAYKCNLCHGKFPGFYA